MCYVDVIADVCGCMCVCIRLSYWLRIVQLMLGMGMGRRKFGQWMVVLGTEEGWGKSSREYKLYPNIWCLLNKTCDLLCLWNRVGEGVRGYWVNESVTLIKRNRQSGRRRVREKEIENQKIRFFSAIASIHTDALIIRMMAFVCCGISSKKWFFVCLYVSSPCVYFSQFSYWIFSMFF